MSTPYDVAVLGSGPAGAVLTHALVGYGLTVAVIARARRYHAIEGVSQRALAGFSYAKCAHALSLFTREATRSAQWNGDHFAGNREYVVDRKRLDDALLADVRQAGADLFLGRANGISASGQEWQVKCARAGNTHVLKSRFLVDARGRSASRAGSGWRRGPPTFSFGQRWSAPASKRPSTRIKTFDGGWVWHADDGDGTSSVQVFVDGSGTVPSATALGRHYVGLLDAAGVLSWVRGARPNGAVFVRDATMSLSEDPCAQRRARVGDAAFALDPLAGHGVYEALSGALALAAVINTALRTPTRTQLAYRYYNDKLQEDFTRMSRTGRDFYREETRWPEAAFWRARQAWPDAAPSHPPLASEAPVIEKRAVSDNGFISEREVVVTPDHPRGVWRVAGVPLAALLKLLHEREGRGPSIEVAAKQLKCSQADVQSAAQWLITRGLFSAT